ncbi:MAG: hypothetical protein JSV45_05920 [Chromatiales bacterium]|nr:MAG: hypothetical protein JSV45_05920 [Chromatiales bacterium]
MWEARTLEIPAGQRIRLVKNGSRLPFRQLFSLLEHDPDFREWYSQALMNSALEAFFWEHPPVTSATFDNEAEFVLLNAPSLAGVRADSTAFESQFASQPQGDVLVFPNLGGDALLIVPRPVGRLEAYPHLAAFLRHAPQAQVHALWRTVATTVREQLSTTPMWLSTAGLGVYWLHLRLDTRPKYYSFAPYKLAA